MFLQVGNGSHECENATEHNIVYMESNPGLRVYYPVMVALTLTNSALNFVCLLAFRAMRPRRRFNRLLARLSVAETLFQAAFFCNQCLAFALDSNRLVLPNLQLSLVAAALLSISLFLCTTFHLMRNWTVVLISRHRWLAVQSLSTSEANVDSSATGCYGDRVLACGVVLCSALVALPRLFELRPVVCAPWSMVTHVDGLLNARRAYRLAYLGCLLCLFQNAGPIICLAGYSLDLVRRLARQGRRRRLSSLACQRSSRSRSMEARNRTVLLLCLAFCLCEWPTLLKSLDPMTTATHWQVAGLIANLLTCLDSTLNISVYYCSHEGFARALLDLLRCRGRRHNDFSAAASGAATARRSTLQPPATPLQDVRRAGSSSSVRETAMETAIEIADREIE